MQVYQRTIEYSKPGDIFTLVPHGDAHAGALAHEGGRYKDMLSKYGKRKNTLLLDVGDACDCILKGDSKRFRPSVIHPDMLLQKKDGKIHVREDWVDREINYIVDLHKKYVRPENMLGFASGNHMDDVLRYHNTDPTQRICDALNTTNIGYCFYYNLNFKRKGKASQQLTIYGHHGFGGGRSRGGSINRYTSDADTKYGADICVYGHDHQLWTWPMPRIFSMKGVIHEERVMVADCGSFLKTHAESEIPTYSEKAGYRPVALGHPTISIEITEKPDNPFEIHGTV